MRCVKRMDRMQRMQEIDQFLDFASSKVRQLEEVTSEKVREKADFVIRDKLLNPVILFKHEVLYIVHVMVKDKIIEELLWWRYESLELKEG